MRDLTGLKFNKLKVIKQISSNRNGNTVWECKCDCGKIKMYSSDHLTRKKQSVKSCGCLRKIKGKYHRDFKGIGDLPKGWWSQHIDSKK